jgi:hypothetical protein
VTPGSGNLPTRSKQPSVAIVTAWQNHPELAPDYFNAAETAAPDQLVIVDDGSDEPVEFAATRLDSQPGSAERTTRASRSSRPTTS